MKKITIGARGSKLSLAYADKVKKLMLESEIRLSNDNIEIQSIKTSGDIFDDKKLSEIGGKNLFCKEIEESLIKKKNRYSSSFLERYGLHRNTILKYCGVY